MDQNWEMLDKGNGYVLYRLKNTRLCLTADTPVGNSSIVALRDCAYNGANGTQDWIGSLNPNSPVYGGGQAQPPATLIRTGGAGTGQITTSNPIGASFPGQFLDLKAGIPVTVANPEALWVYGGLQEIDICNGNSGFRVTAKSRFLTSSNLSINSVEYKMYSRINNGLSAIGNFVGYISTENWRDISEQGVSRNGDTFTVNRFNTFTGGIQPTTPVKISTHVKLSNGQTIYDLGGIIDFGEIPYDTCKPLWRR
jgi:hypothetical protein